MAGSLNHIVNDDGTFTMECIENLGDAHEALEECHQIVALLLTRAAEATGLPAGAILKKACNDLAFPVPAVGVNFHPQVRGVNVPVIQPELHGVKSIFKKAAGG